ncbi:TIGR00341 family protein [Methanococcus maripaludis]|uniref:Hydrophobic protein (TIGR00341 family) n=2 Tax=Methanococcus maripaludis TaxID=39152 RepID=A6VGX2_METM7|nr:TIGR00341 family protein [Methanococcus maripaludis]MBA2861352.1 putative hydrophobic protein (TIGR00341 family) [Methanococcus maripaludis]
MNVRLIECYVPKKIYSGYEESLENNLENIIWHSVCEESNHTVIRLITETEHVEKVIDVLSSKYGGSNFRIIVTEPTATIPEIKKEEKVEVEDKTPKRVSRHEIIGKIGDVSHLSKEYYSLLFLAAVVASIGIWLDDVALIIGSMIIAPFLSPMISFTFSVAVMDLAFAKKSLKNLLLGILTVLIFSFVIGTFLHVSPESPQIASRMNLGLQNIAIALSAGFVGTLSMLIPEISSTVVGVMIAVALMPPLVAFGLMLGSGYYIESIPILILFIVNIISVNFASAFLFYLYGITPYKWWEIEKARKLAIFSIIFWFLNLVILTSIILTFGNGNLKII